MGSNRRLTTISIWSLPGRQRRRRPVSFEHFDPGAVAGRLGERTVAGDDRCPEPFGEGDVHRVVCADVVAQLPGATQEIDVGVTMKIEVSEIRDRFLGTTGRDFTAAHETSKGLDDLDVHKVRRVQFMVASKEAGLNSFSKRGPQKKFQHRRSIDDNQADSRSSRMIAAAGVFRVTRLRL